MSKRKAPEQSVPTPTSRGAPPSARSTRPASAVAAARSGGGNEALRAAWEEFGQPELYEAPDAQELSDLGDARNRRRGERVQRKRLERGWLRLQREMAAQQQAEAMVAQAEAEAARDEAAAKRARLEARVAAHLTAAERADAVFSAFSAAVEEDGGDAVDEETWDAFLPMGRVAVTTDMSSDCLYVSTRKHVQLYCCVTVAGRAARDSQLVKH
jgi:hypothetical protein